MEENQEIEEVKQVEEVNEVNEEKSEGSKFMSEGDDSVIKIDLTKPPVTKEDADTEQEAADVVADEQTEPIQEVVEEVPQGEEAVQVEEPVAESTEVEETVETVEEPVVNAVPENLQKLVDFMEETGGTVQDFVELNRDYNDMDNLTALREYYKKTKPHLSGDEIDFLMDDQFSYEEDLDDEKEIKRKKLALKEQVASAKAYLDGQKSKYYEEIKGGSKLPDEAQKAMDFFNRYNKESEEKAKMAKKQKSSFLNKTNEVFNDEFKGFEYNVGEKKYRFNVKNSGEVKQTQNDINNFIRKFHDEKGEMSDAKGYHKSIFTAMNADAIAKHFYEQGKADATKDSVAKAKNVDMKPREAHKTIEAGGLKFKVLGDNSSDFKFKIKKRK